MHPTATFNQCFNEFCNYYFWNNINSVLLISVINDLGVQ